MSYEYYFCLDFCSIMAETFDDLVQALSGYDFEEKFRESCCPLPFFLQDLCLLVVINELDSYPTELLATLPYWLRCRILSILPAVDLARLESTAVADGIETDEMWKARLKDDRKMFQRAHGVGSEASSMDGRFQLKICSRMPLDLLRFSGYIPGRENKELTEEIIKDLEVNDSVLSTGKKNLLDIASDLFTKEYTVRDQELTEVTHQLVSVSGTLVFSNLLTGYVHEKCPQYLHCNREMWKRQATVLDVKDLRFFYNNRIQLTPRHLLPYCDKHDAAALLSLLCARCQLHPCGVNIEVERFSRSFLPSLCAEILSVDGGLSLPTANAEYMAIVNHFLENVVSLRLRCENYARIGLVVSMIKAAVAKGQGSNLKHLICSIPNLYMDIVESLCSLFSLQSFHLLTLDLNEVCLLTLSKLLRAFLTAPCSREQKLIIHIKQGLQLEMVLKQNQVGAVSMKGLNIPPCSLEHKVLKFSSNDDFNKVLYLLLQFPTLRLKQVVLCTSSEHFHLCAAHPDLQMTNLDITVDGSDKSYHRQQLATLQKDLVSLLAKHSLQKIRISGEWCQLSQVKLGLELGLQGRSHLPPLKRLSLELEECDHKPQNSYEVSEFQSLCDAIFALPQLNNLKLVLGKGFADLIRQQSYEEVVYKSWSDSGAGIKLKSILLHTYTTNLEQMALITSNLSFSFNEPSPTNSVSSYDDHNAFFDYLLYHYYSDPTPWFYYDFY